jgi:type I restriction enzyme S subunit
VGEFRRFVSDAAVRQTSTNVIQRGQLLIVTRTGVGKLALAPCDIAISQDITGLYVDEAKADPDFLLHRMRLGVEDLKKLNQGTSINGIIRSDLTAYPFELPPLPLQRRISAILSALDRTIERTEALVEKDKKIRLGLMQDLFVRGLKMPDVTGSKNLSRRTRFGLLPAHWKTGSLLDITDRYRQPILTGPFGAELGNDDFVEDGVPLLRIGNVQHGRMDLRDLLFVNLSKAQQHRRYAVREGDLLFARQGATTGRNALASREVNGFLINYHIIRVALDNTCCAPLFIEAAFASEIVMRQIERDKGRGTREGINTAQLTALEIPIAPLDEQRRIADVLESAGIQIEVAERQLSKLQALKNGLARELLEDRTPSGAEGRVVEEH